MQVVECILPYYGPYLEGTGPILPYKTWRVTNLSYGRALGFMGLVFGRFLGAVRRWRRETRQARPLFGIRGGITVFTDTLGRVRRIVRDINPGLPAVTCCDTCTYSPGCKIIVIPYFRKATRPPTSAHADHMCGHRIRARHQPDVVSHLN